MRKSRFSQSHAGRSGHRKVDVGLSDDAADAERAADVARSSQDRGGCDTGDNQQVGAQPGTAFEPPCGQEAEEEDRRSHGCAGMHCQQTGRRDPSHYQDHAGTRTPVEGLAEQEYEARD